MPPSQKQRIEHGHCLALQASQAFAYYLADMQRRADRAQVEVCAETQSNRDYQAGRLSAFTDAMQFVDRKYRELKDIVEVIE